MGSKGIVRGCGTRVKGGVYAEIPLAENGVPLDTFLVCPPQPLNAGSLRLSPRGVSLIERAGVWHVVDWIGSAHYPNVADVIAEARRHGISRRLPRTLDFAKLGRGSRLLLAHSRAHLHNADGLRSALREEAVARLHDGHTEETPLRGRCPRGRADHLQEGMCQALYVDDVEGGETVLDPAVPFRTVNRQIGDTTYRARRRPEGFTPQYGLAIFMAVPIGKLAVIDNPGAPEEVADTLERARKVRGIDVTLEEQ